MLLKSVLFPTTVDETTSGFCVPTDIEFEAFFHRFSKFGMIRNRLAIKTIRDFLSLFRGGASRVDFRSCSGHRKKKKRRDFALPVEGPAASALQSCPAPSLSWSLGQSRCSRNGRETPKQKACVFVGWLSYCKKSAGSQPKKNGHSSYSR